MITNRVQVRTKQGRTSTTVKREDGELSAEVVLSKELTTILSKRCGPSVEAIYIEVILK